MPPLRRTTARKSVTPAPARLCFVSNPRYGVELPAASNDVSFDSELDKAISPVPGIFSASSSAAAEAALDPNNAALETKEEDEVFVPFNDAAFVASSECSAGMEVSRDECKVDCDIVESGKYDVVDGGQQVVVDCEGEKVKKVVKKTVKVVKIVKRMVRRKVSSEGADDAKVDNVAEILSPDSRVSCVVESKELEPGSSSVGLNMQNLNSQVEEAKENTLMEIDNNGVVQKQTALVMEVDENRNGEYEHGSEDAGNVDRQEEEEEEVVEEAEEGVVKCFSAKLEAMERRKRRKTEVFVDGLDKDAKEEDVRTVFAEAGEIVDLTVLVNSKTGKNEGYAFVRYATTEEAKRALKKFSRVKICGKECGATPLEKNDTILLGNIDKEWKNEDIIKTLQGIGIENIDRVTVMVDQDNSEFNQGFAFVELETSKDAQIAYKKLQKKYVSKRNMGIKVAWAKPLKEFEEEDLLKKNVNVYFATVPESKILKPAAKILSKQSPNDPKISHSKWKPSEPRNRAPAMVPNYDIHVQNEIKNRAHVTLPHHNFQIRHKPRNRTQSAVPHHDTQISKMSSTDVELIRLLREQASWRTSHTSAELVRLFGKQPPRESSYNSLNSTGDMQYSLCGRKHQSLAIEAEPLYSGLSTCPHSCLDASFPVTSSRLFVA